jgi:branched-chain amino acid transport system permease protein
VHSMKTAGLLKFLVRGLPVAVVLVVCPFVLPVYWTLILTEILIMGFFAMSFNLLLGYTGLLSFGQAGFFGVGAYCVGLMLTHGGESLFLALAAGTLTAAVASLMIGFLCVRRDEIYFAMITLGFGMMLYTVAHNWIELTGGSDGLPLLTVPPLRLFGLELSLFEPATMYFTVLVVCSAGVFVLWRVVHSPFGLMLTAMRENKERLSFAGADVRRVRLAAFAVAGGLAGLAGGLFALFNTMATPDFLNWSFSARPVLMTILGGSGIFFGPAFGAAVFFGLEQLTTHFTENWMIVLGAILILVVIFFPRGILGTAVHHFRTGRERRP